MQFSLLFQLQGGLVLALGLTKKMNLIYSLLKIQKHSTLIILFLHVPFKKILSNHLTSE